MPSDLPPPGSPDYPGTAFPVSARAARPTLGVHAVRGVARGWWLFLLRGLLGILFGAAVLANPGAGLATVLLLLAAWMAADGLVTLWQAITGRRHGVWFWLDGLVSLAAAAFIMARPAESAYWLALLAGAWSLVTGVFELVAGLRGRSWLLGLAGLASLAVGAYFLAYPALGLLLIVTLIGVQALVFGVLLLALGWRLRHVAHDPHAHGFTDVVAPAGPRVG